MGAAVSDMTGLIGAKIGADASKKASKAQTKAADKANQTLKDMYSQNRTDAAPWRDIGVSSLSQLGYLMGLPGYMPQTVTPVNATQAPLGQGANMATTLGLTPQGGSQGTGTDGLGRGENLPGNQVAMLKAPGYGPEGSITRGDLAMPLQGDVMASTTTASPAGSTLPASSSATFSPGGYGDFARSFGMADFEEDPGYAFRLAEGQKALERSAAARGLSLSGAQLKALTQYGQDQGSQEFMNSYNRWNNDRANLFNRYATLAGLGQTANSQVMQLGSNTASQVGQNLVGAGNARAAGYMGQANAWRDALTNIGNNAWRAEDNGMKVFSSFMGGGMFGG